MVAKGYFQLLGTADADIDTPPTGYVNLYDASDHGNTPYYKDPAGAVHAFAGATGPTGPAYDVVVAHGNTGTTETFDVSAGNFHTATLNANCTFTFTGAVNGVLSVMGIRLTQDGTGSRTVTWSASVI